MEEVSRGCIKNSDQVHLHCRISSFSSLHKKHQGGGEYGMICCEGDYCNDGPFPQLREVTFHS